MTQKETAVPVPDRFVQRIGEAGNSVSREKLAAARQLIRGA